MRSAIPVIDHVVDSNNQSRAYMMLDISSPRGRFHSGSAKDGTADFMDCLTACRNPRSDGCAKESPIADGPELAVDIVARVLERNSQESAPQNFLVDYSACDLRPRHVNVRPWRRLGGDQFW